MGLPVTSLTSFNLSVKCTGIGNKPLKGADVTVSPCHRVTDDHRA
ncbi:hypothetical protein PS941_05099 [Pseudomonas fluorescens]|uniref:Uncharacterized protein n=1 Tax=Pseudomonas fluorescens TaxID=294 RepID=A0A5E7VAC2_PSEFL|nr:hypothetical protein PS941_05099 [Pseudomonas fluorescens]